MTATEKEIKDLLQYIKLITSDEFQIRDIDKMYQNIIDAKPSDFKIVSEHGKPTKTSEANLNIADVITPFWLWLVREANVEVIDAETAIEVWGLGEDKHSLVPVVTLPELIELYKSENGL